MLRKIKEDVNKGRAVLCSQIDRLKLGKMSVLSKMIQRLSAILGKTPGSFFDGSWQADSKIHMEIQKFQKSQNKFESENELEKKKKMNWKTRISQF